MEGMEWWHERAHHANAVVSSSLGEDVVAGVEEAPCRCACGTAAGHMLGLCAGDTNGRPIWPATRARAVREVVRLTERHAQRRDRVKTAQPLGTWPGAAAATRAVASRCRAG